MPSVNSLTDVFGAIISTEGGEGLDSLEDDCVRDTFQERGAILFRGFAPCDEDFERFSARFSSGFIDHRYAAQLVGFEHRAVNVDPTVYHVSAGCEAIPHHAEDAGLPDRPDTLFFHCVRPAAQGGRTLLCDGNQVLRHLEVEDRRLFETPVVYTQYFSGEAWNYIFECRSQGDADHALSGFARQCRERGWSLDWDFIKHEQLDDCLRFSLTAPAITSEFYRDAESFSNWLFVTQGGFQYGDRVIWDHPRFSDGSDVPQDTIDHVYKTVESLELPLDWLPGDVLMVDNARMMHGREQIGDPDREIHSRIARRPNDWKTGS